MEPDVLLPCSKEPATGHCIKRKEEKERNVKLRVKLSLSLTKHHTMKTYWGRWLEE
jgi:hypothetical protein